MRRNMLFLAVQIRHGCDPNMWGEGPGGCRQTLLHRAIDENNETIGCFLVRRYSAISWFYRKLLRSASGSTSKYLVNTWNTSD